MSVFKDVSVGKGEQSGGGGSQADSPPSTVHDVGLDPRNLTS